MHDSAPRAIQRFEILAELGSGGMGTVYRARDPQLEREVAIKLLRAVAAPPSELSWERTLDLRAGGAPSDTLLAEARVMARLSDPNVLPVFEAGLHDGAVFLVVELVDGTNAREWLAEGPSPARIRDAFAQAARGLAAAHAREIVHGDFKPDNILVGRDGRVRVADFGLSQLARRPTLVRTDDTAGTPDYMAPELLRGEPRTKSSDVYAFACSLAEALIGAPPAQAIGDLSRIAPPLRTLVSSALDADPARRPSIDAFVTALADDRGHGRRRRRIAAVFAGLALVGGATVVVVNRGDDALDCSPPPSDQWTIARRVDVLRAVVGDPGEVVALIDQKHAAIAGARTAACTSRARGDITDSSRAQRTSCLARRELELDAIVDRITLARPPAVQAGDWVFGMASIPACDVITAPPLVIDRSVIAPLFRRYMLANELPATKDQLDAFTAIERGAGALGERELEARCATMRGSGCGDIDRLADGIEAFRLAHQRAIALSAFDIGAVALLERVNAVGGSGGLRRCAEPARPRARARRETGCPSVDACAADRGGGAQRARARALQEALALAERGRQVLAESGRIVSFIETVLRQEQFRSLREVKGAGRETLALAEDNAAYVLRTIGGAAPNYGVMLSSLASEQWKLGMQREALDTVERSIAVISAAKGATHSDVLRGRLQKAGFMMAMNDYRGGRDELLAILAAAETNDAFRDRRAYLLHALAESQFNLGAYDEAMRLLPLAVDEEISVRGTNHPNTTNRLRTQLLYALELGRFADARNLLQRVERAYTARAETPPQDKLAVEYYAASLALADGKATAAEAAARRSLAGFRELSLDKTEDMADAYEVLARSLLAQRRWAEALEAAEAGLVIARALAQREDYLAQRELPWIHAAMMLGRTDEARARAIAARDVLAKYPGQPRGRAVIADLSTKLGLPR